MDVDDETLDKIAIYLRENLAVKSRQLGPRGKPVNYFSGKRMIDFLMASKYCKENDEDGPLQDRNHAIIVAKMMMQKQLFYRAAFGEKKVKKKDGTIKTKKIVLILGGLPQAYHERNFQDEDVPFVWTYDPVTRKTLMYGLLLLGFVCACAALPLWPNWLRNIVIAFLLFILIGRPGLWLVIWLATFSRWNFYILPNLDEDISFEKRFTPLYLFERSETASGGDNDEDDGEGDEDGDEDDDGDDDDGEGEGDLDE